MPEIDTSRDKSAEVDSTVKPEQQPSSTFKRWSRRVERAKKIREDWESEYKVETCEKYFLGKQFATGDKTLVLNHFLSTVKTIQPDLFLQNPKFLVRPKPRANNPVAPQTARAIEATLDTIGSQDDQLEEATDLALSQAFFRCGIIKTSYDPELVSNPQAGQPIAQTNIDGTPVMDMESGQPIPEVDPVTNQPIVEPDFIVFDEAYRYEWVDSTRFLLPDDGPDERKWTWLGEEIVVPLASAKADERWPAELREQLVTNEDTKKGNKKRHQDQDDDDGMFRYFECYDLTKRTWCQFADDQPYGNQMLLDEEPLPEGIESHPYRILRFIKILNPEPSAWPLPLTLSWLDPQREYNIRRNQIMEGAKRSARKGVYQQGSFVDADEARKFLQSPRDMEFVEVTDINRPPQILQSPDLNQSIYRDIPMLLNDWRVLTGQTGARLGNPDADTATEANFVEQAAGLRASYNKHLVNRWIAGVGKKMLQLLRHTLTLEMWVALRTADDASVQAYFTQVYGIPPQMMQAFPAIQQALIQRFGKEKLVRVTRQELDFESDVTVVAGSSRPRNLASEKAELLEFLQILGQFPQLAMSRALLDEIAAKYEFITPQVVEELQILAQQMIMVAANQAGRGGDNPQAGRPEGVPGTGETTGRAGNQLQ